MAAGRLKKKTASVCVFNSDRLRRAKRPRATVHRVAARTWSPVLAGTDVPIELRVSRRGRPMTGMFRPPLGAGATHVVKFGPIGIAGASNQLVAPRHDLVEAERYQ